MGMSFAYLSRDGVPGGEGESIAVIHRPGRPIPMLLLRLQVSARSLLKCMTVFMQGA